MGPLAARESASKRRGSNYTRIGSWRDTPAAGCDFASLAPATLEEVYIKNMSKHDHVKNMGMRCSLHTIESIFRRGAFRDFRHFQSVPPMHRHNKMILDATNEFRKNPIRDIVSRQLSSFAKEGNQTQIQKSTFQNNECTVRQPRRLRLTTSGPSKGPSKGPLRACDAGAQLAGTTKRSQQYIPQHNIPPPLWSLSGRSHPTRQQKLMIGWTQEV